MKKIKFIPCNREVELFVDPPEPIKKNVPTWYKNIKPIKEKDFVFNKDGKISFLNVRHCIPFLDALTSGYVIKTWTDIHIKKIDNNSVEYHFSSQPQILHHRDRVGIEIDKEMFYNIEFIWKMPWIPKLPKGYSILYTHPMNYFDLPFFSMSSIVDADFYNHTSIEMGNYPFLIKNNFEGIIPKGTPYCQMIPFKRDYWISVVSKFNEIENAKKYNILNSKFCQAYKNFFWQKKQYF